MIKDTLKRKYRDEGRMVEDLEAFFKNPLSPHVPIIHIYLVQMRLCFVWVTVKAFCSRDDWMAHSRALNLLDELNKETL